MKAIVCTKYGSPDVLQIKEIEKPVPEDNEVLIRIHATTATAAHSMMRKGKPLFGRLFTGITRPKNPVPGTEFAGEIEAVGKNVKLFRAGDRVFGSTDLEGGCYAEYICLAEDAVLAPMPANMASEEAAAILDGASTALHFLRDKGNIQPGQNVLINGASGSVGTAAVQLAKYFGAKVTGVCSTANIELVNSLGADNVIDYTQEDFTATHGAYDLIFDAVGKSSFSRCKGSLKQGGVYLTTVAGLQAFVDMAWTSGMGDKKARFGAAGLRSSDEKTKDLLVVKDLAEAGQIRAVIDRRYPLGAIADAHRYVDTGRKKGNAVITVVG